MNTAVFGILAAALLPTAAHAVAPDMKEGLWEITVRMEMPGMDRCEVAGYRMQGNTASWNWTCRGEGAASGTASMTFSGTSYTGVSRMSMHHGGAVQTMTIHYAGRHLGACPK
jgi:hypothetical protein